MCLDHSKQCENIQFLINFFLLLVTIQKQMKQISLMRLNFISNDRNNAWIKKTTKSFSFYYHLFDILPCVRNSGWYAQML